MTDTLCAVPHARDPERPRLALDGLRVCFGHREQIGERVGQLGAAHEALVRRLTASGQGQGHVSGTRPVGLSLIDPVATCRADLYTMLAGWGREVYYNRRLTPPADSCPAIGAFLVLHLDWLCALPAVDVQRLAADLAHFRSLAYGLLYPSGRRRYDAGQCVEVNWCDVPSRTAQRCPGMLTAFLAPADDLLPASLTCDTCWVEIPASQWYAFGRKYQAMGDAA